MLFLLALATTALSFVAGCTTVQTHKEWRELSVFEQQNYLKAIKCLKGQKAQITVQNTVQNREVQHLTRWEDFAYLYGRARFNSYDSPDFLPWHRAFLALIDNELRTNEGCKYTGPMPYWDWSLDSNSPATSKIWDSFGKYGCIDAPILGKWTNTMYNPPRCASRASTGLGGGWHFSPLVISHYHGTSHYNDFRLQAEFKLSYTFTMAMGGDFLDKRMMVNDPLFPLHIRNIDRLWALWQAKNNNQNLMAYGGFFVKDGKRTDVTLYDSLSFKGLYRDVKVMEVMNTVGDGLDGMMCYVYSKSLPPVAPLPQLVKNIAEWLNTDIRYLFRRTK